MFHVVVDVYVGETNIGVRVYPVTSFPDSHLELRFAELTQNDFWCGCPCRAVVTDISRVEN